MTDLDELAAATIPVPLPIKSYVYLMNQRGSSGPLWVIAIGVAVIAICIGSLTYKYYAFLAELDSRERAMKHQTQEREKQDEEIRQLLRKDGYH